MLENGKDDRPPAEAGGLHPFRDARRPSSDAGRLLTEECTCPKTGCERRGKCAECIAHHARKGKLPRCKR